MCVCDEKQNSWKKEEEDMVRMCVIMCVSVHTPSRYAVIWPLTTTAQSFSCIYISIVTRLQLT